MGSSDRRRGSSADGYGSDMEGYGSEGYDDLDDFIDDDDDMDWRSQLRAMTGMKTTMPLDGSWVMPCLSGCAVAAVPAQQFRPSACLTPLSGNIVHFYLHSRREACDYSHWRISVAWLYHV